MKQTVADLLSEMLLFLNLEESVTLNFQKSVQLDENKIKWMGKIYEHQNWILPWSWST